MASVEQILKHDNLQAGEQVLDDFFAGFIFEDNMVVTANGVITTALEIRPIEKESLTESQFEAIHGTINSIVKMCPKWTTLHLQTFVSAPPTRFKSEEEEGFFTRHLKRHLMDRPVNRVSMTLYLSFSARSMEYNPLTSPFARVLSWLKMSFSQNPLESKLLARKKAAVDLTNSIAKMLNSVPGLGAKGLLQDKLRLRVARYVSLNQFKQDASMDTQVARDGSVLLLGLKNVAIVRLNQSGEFLDTHRDNRNGLPAFMTDKMGTHLNFPHVVNQVLVVKDTEKTLGMLRTTANLIRQLGSIGSNSNLERLRMFEEFVAKTVETDNPVVELHHNVITWAFDRSHLADQCNEIMTTYNNINGSFGIIEDLDVLNWFTAMIPGMAAATFNGHKMLSHEALCYFDWSVETHSENQGIIVSNRNGELMHLDVWADWLSAKNVTIVGPTGSGKSFFTNSWLVQWYEQGFDVVIIDIGGSYKSVTNILGGKYMEYDPSSPIALNPFWLPKSDDFSRWVLTDDKRQFLISVLTCIWKDSGQTLDRVEEAILSDLLTKFVAEYNKENTSAAPRLVDFFTWVQTQEASLADHGRFDLYGFITVLRRWCEGEFKQILNAVQTEDINDQRLICFDLEGVKDIPALRPVVALLIMEMVLDKIRHRKHVRKAIFMDEAWSFLGGSPELAKFMEYLFRTCRKQNASSGIITQSILELTSSTVGRAIANNTPIKVLLDHAGKSDQLPLIQEFFGLSDLDIAKVKSIRKTETSREFFMKREEHSGVYMLDAGPVAATAFSSSPEDRTRMVELVKKYRRFDYAVSARVEEKMAKVEKVKEYQ